MIRELSQRDLFVLDSRCGPKRKTLAELAKLLGVSKQMVFYIEHRVRKALREADSVLVKDGRNPSRSRYRPSVK